MSVALARVVVDVEASRPSAAEVVHEGAGGGAVSGSPGRVMEASAPRPVAAQRLRASGLPAVVPDADGQAETPRAGVLGLADISCEQLGRAKLAGLKRSRSRCRGGGQAWLARLGSSPTAVYRCLLADQHLEPPLRPPGGVASPTLGCMAPRGGLPAVGRPPHAGLHTGSGQERSRARGRRRTSDGVPADGRSGRPHPARPGGCRCGR